MAPTQFMPDMLHLPIAVTQAAATVCHYQAQVMLPPAEHLPGLFAQGSGQHRCMARMQHLLIHALCALMLLRVTKRTWSILWRRTRQSLLQWGTAAQAASMSASRL